MDKNNLRNNESINNIVYNSKQKKELYTSLTGRNEIAAKFLYLKDGAKKWIELAASPKCRIFKDEIKLIEEIKKELFKITNYENIFDIGCGEGKKAKILLNAVSALFLIHLLQ